MRPFLLFFVFSLFLLQPTAAQINLVGLTRGDAGRIVKYNVATKQLTTAYTMNADKAVPWYNDLVQAKNGLLYGMTENGGVHNAGILFSYDPASGVYKKLVDFTGTSNGGSPYGALIEGPNGLLYGMTEGGGANNHGTIFSFNYATNSLTVLYSFNSTQGRSPFGSLTQASDGKLYGMTESGGSNDFGTIFSFNPNSKDYNVVHHFDGPNGRSPYGSLVLATDGKMYGMTQFGGTDGFGVLFSITPNQTSSYVKRAEFKWSNGAWPNSTLVQAGSKLYGMTESGGANNFGVVFSFDPASSTLSNVSDFSEANGRSPYGSLMKASDNKLYGMTFRGGTYDKGVLFSFDPATPVSPLKKLVDFNGTNGLNPAASMVELKENSVLPLTLVGFTAKEEDKTVKLEWLVETEVDIDHYEIQRSLDGVQYTSIGTVKALNVQSRHQYQFTDMQPAAGNNYYRLKIHEKFTAPHYSPIKVVHTGEGSFKASVQPNPVHSDAKLHVRLTTKSQVQLQLYNTQGVLLQQWPATSLDKGEHFIPLPLTQLPAGNYVLLVNAGVEKRVIQLVKLSRN